MSIKQHQPWQNQEPASALSFLSIHLQETAWCDRAGHCDANSLPPPTPCPNRRCPRMAAAGFGAEPQSAFTDGSTWTGTSASPTSVTCAGGNPTGELCTGCCAFLHEPGHRAPAGCIPHGSGPAPGVLGNAPGAGDHTRRWSASGQGHVDRCHGQGWLRYNMRLRRPSFISIST